MRTRFASFVMVSPAPHFGLNRIRFASVSELGAQAGPKMARFGTEVGSRHHTLRPTDESREPPKRFAPQAHRANPFRNPGLPSFDGGRTWAKTAWIGLVGLVPLLTGIFGFCPIYRILGLRTSSTHG
ncbi:MAG: DUF2892 domain-containing protein [Polyangiaceae bacterium]